MRIGVALPQYDYSIAGENPLRYETILDHARAAAAAGYDSLWLSDHLWLDLDKYGGGPEPYGAFEPIVTLGALVRDVPDVRFGTLVCCEAFRPASVLAKSVATLALLSGGRIDLGLGAGWYEPEYAAIGMEFPPPGRRIDRLRDAVDVVAALLDSHGEPVTAGGAHHRVEQARLLPPVPIGQRPRLFVGGKGDRVLRVAARAGGWNTCWVWTPEAYQERIGAFEAACAAVGRDPATVWRTLGLYALAGEDDADLRRRFERLRARTPPGILDGTSLEEFRVGRLVGTRSEVREQASRWAELGIETLVVGAGAVPFQVGDLEDVLLIADVLSEWTGRG